jgi:hypothetical protein
MAPPAGVDWPQEAEPEKLLAASGEIASPARNLRRVVIHSLVFVRMSFAMAVLQPDHHSWFVFGREWFDERV